MGNLFLNFDLINKNQLQEINKNFKISLRKGWF